MASCLTMNTSYTTAGSLTAGDTIYIVPLPQANSTTTGTVVLYTIQEASPANYYCDTQFIEPKETLKVEGWALRRAASLVLPSRENKAHSKLYSQARKGFQQLARIPCYRGTRTR